MNQKNFPDQYEQAKADQFFQREKDAIDMQHYQAEREYDKRNPGIRDIGPEARRDIMNNNPGRYVNQRKVKPGRDYRYDSEMKNGEKEMNDTFGKQSWFPGNFDEQ